MSSQSSSINYMESLLLVEKYLYQYGGTTFIVLGSVVCILNLIVFMQKNLRKNPCSIYFIAFNVANILFICLPLFFAVLATGYGIEPSAYNLISCRFNIYTALVLDILSPFYLILASIDRILITSRNAQIRRRSTCRLAYQCVIAGTLFWMLFQSHVFFLTNIEEIAPNQFSCYFQSGAYLVFVGIYIVMIKGIAIPLIMGIFGMVALKNIRQLRCVAVVPVLSAPPKSSGVVGLYSFQSKDRQLILMLLIDIITYILFSSVLVIFLLYQLITQYQTKSTEQIQLELFIRFVATLIAYIPSSIGGFTNIFVSKTFRSELKKIFSCH